jgi:hypothetical protein
MIVVVDVVDDVVALGLLGVSSTVCGRTYPHLIFLIMVMIDRKVFFVLLIRFWSVIFVCAYVVWSVTRLAGPQGVEFWGSSPFFLPFYRYCQEIRYGRV